MSGISPPPGEPTADPVSTSAGQPTATPVSATAQLASKLSASGAPNSSLRGADTSADAVRARYGVYVVTVGLLVILAGFVLAVLHYSDAGSVSTALAPITGVVGTIVGAYFGVQVGSQGKAESDSARTQAENQAKALAAVAPADLATSVLGLSTSPSERAGSAGA